MVKTTKNVLPYDTPYPFRSTITPNDERLLAYSLGYPPKWQVSRIAPHPDDVDRIGIINHISNDKGMLITHTSDKKPYEEKVIAYTTCLDTIYAGDPEDGVDTYYNHAAAYEAAMKWNTESSTGYDDNGGQLLPRQAKYFKGDKVEVLYYEDEIWYDAVIEKVKIYDNAIRYTVYYEIDDTLQSNVNENEIRERLHKKRKLKLKYQNSFNNNNKSEMEEFSKPKVNYPQIETIKTLYVPNPNDLKLASEMSLPKGWTARRNLSRYAFKSPDGKLTFYTMKSVFKYLGLPSPLSRKLMRGTVPSVTEIVMSVDEEEPQAKFIEEKLMLSRQGLVNEEGDPPWRTTKHQYLGRRIQYIIKLDDEKEIEALGTITGWIAATDVDKDGQPGFISEKNGQPASLFHVTFDKKYYLESQDLEEYEVKECLIDKGRSDAIMITFTE